MSRFSRTGSVAKTCLPSGTSEHPRATMRSGLSPSTGSPRKSTSPPRAGVSPAMLRSSVLFPAPFAPMMVAISPRFTWSETRRSAATGP